MRLRFMSPLMLTAAAGLGLGIGCNPYAPDLPDMSFACAQRGIRCPSGFVCDESLPTKSICRKKGSAGGGGSDAGSVDGGAPVSPCDGPPDRDFEPNENPPAAIQLPSMRYVVTSVGICSPDDTDMFWVEVGAGKRMVLRLDFTHTDGDLVLTLLNVGVQQLANSDVSSVDNNFESIDFRVMTAGKYYIRVKGKQPSVRNTYMLTVDLLD